MTDSSLTSISPGGRSSPLTVSLELTPIDILALNATDAAFADASASVMSSPSTFISSSPPDVAADVTLSPDLLPCFLRLPRRPRAPRRRPDAGVPLTSSFLRFSATRGGEDSCAVVTSGAGAEAVGRSDAGCPFPLLPSGEPEILPSVGAIIRYILRAIESTSNRRICPTASRAPRIDTSRRALEEGERKARPGVGPLSFRGGRRQCRREYSASGPPNQAEESLSADRRGDAIVAQKILVQPVVVPLDDAVAVSDRGNRRRAPRGGRRLCRNR